MNNNSDKGCKGYCFQKNDSSEAMKICNNPDCKNKDRAKKLIREYSEKLLKEVEKNLY